MVRYLSNQDISLIALLGGRVVFEITGIENIARIAIGKCCTFRTKLKGRGDSGGPEAEGTAHIEATLLP